MTQSSKSPQQVADGGCFEFGTIDRKDWNLEQYWVAIARSKNSPRYTEYRNFLGRYLPPDGSSATGFYLLDLRPADKWLLMYATDVFFDHSVCFHDDPEGWLEAWRRSSESMLPGYNLILQSPDAIDRVKLEEAWERFRTAIS